MTTMTRRRAVPSELWLLLAVVVGAVLVISSVPVVLRAVLALPALVLVPGWLLSRLVLTSSAGTCDSEASGNGAADAEASQQGVLDYALPFVLGLVLTLATVLIVNVFQIKLTQTPLAIGQCAWTLILLAGGRLPLLADRATPTPWNWRRAGAVAAALALLVGALAVARAVQPSQGGTRYEALTLASSAQQLQVRPGATVGLGWTANGYGGSPLASDIAVTVGGDTPQSLKITLAEKSESSGVSSQDGTAEFIAPTVAGTYRVLVSAGAGAQVTTYLTVTR